jgi:hypothetical protein
MHALKNNHAKHFNLVPSPCSSISTEQQSQSEATIWVNEGFETNEAF